MEQMVTNDTAVSSGIHETNAICVASQELRNVRANPAADLHKFKLPHGVMKAFYLQSIDFNLEVQVRILFVRVQLSVHELGGDFRLILGKILAARRTLVYLFKETTRLRYSF